MYAPSVNCFPSCGKQWPVYRRMTTEYEVPAPDRMWRFEVAHAHIVAPFVPWYKSTKHAITQRKEINCNKQVNQIKGIYKWVLFFTDGVVPH